MSCHAARDVCMDARSHRFSIRVFHPVLHSRLLHNDGLTEPDQRNAIVMTFTSVAAEAKSHRGLILLEEPSLSSEGTFDFKLRIPRYDFATSGSENNRWQQPAGIPSDLECSLTFVHSQNGADYIMILTIAYQDQSEYSPVIVGDDELDCSRYNKPQAFARFGMMCATLYSTIHVPVVELVHGGPVTSERTKGRSACSETILAASFMLRSRRRQVIIQNEIVNPCGVDVTNVLAMPIRCSGSWLEELPPTDEDATLQLTTLTAIEPGN
ncbi:uncharacterized protein LAESUDRAFT_751997 [Laetiporus sulphureus 93-53]|uniref:Uncharacterized protein n=1 Tax=Laetiporus sulphureus 93-53 TaxID=1314785 RepID=A0A165CEG8_9APHY|nr:uncharacterized protein LAESUDRAFT_751997 [Laetiporus sulphureus 93-53]KZT02667.1 hypothetical protein LAESUDRAFT_751997 [Laetiporus sulphureus 93-53]